MQTLVKNDKTLNPVATLVLQKTQLNIKKFKKQYKIHLPLLQKCFLLVMLLRQYLWAKIIYLKHVKDQTEMKTREKKYNEEVLMMMYKHSVFSSNTWVYSPKWLIFIDAQPSWMNTISDKVTCMTKILLWLWQIWLWWLGRY